MGWFKNLTGISTPSWLKDIDDKVISPTVKSTAMATGWGVQYNLGKGISQNIQKNTQNSTSMTLTNERLLAEGKSRLIANSQKMLNQDLAERKRQADLDIAKDKKRLAEMSPKKDNTLLYVLLGFIGFILIRKS